jgi:hypothetical protein
MARTIQSPGVEIREVDLSLRPQLPIGTNIFALGYAPQGPTNEILNVTSLSEFEQVYGLPTNAAERYFYHTVKSAFQSDGNITVTRLPYGSSGGDTEGTEYSVLAYPVFPRPKLTSLVDTSLSAVTSYDSTSDCRTVISHVASAGWEAADSDTFFIGEPSTVVLTQAEFEKIEGNQITFDTKLGKPTTFSTYDSLSGAGLLVVNNKKLAIDENFNGHYVGIVDNTNGSPAWDHDSVLAIKSKNKSKNGTLLPGGYVDVPTDRLSVTLSAYANTYENISAGNTHTPNSISQIVEGAGGNLYDSEFSDILTICTYKVRQSISDVNKLDAYITGSAAGSLSQYKTKNNTTGGTESYFLETVSDNGLSPYVRTIINDNIHQQSWYDDEKKPTSRVRVYSKNYDNDTDSCFVDDAEKAALSAFAPALSGSGLTHAENLYANGTFKENSATGGDIGQVPTKIGRVFELADNFELYPIDVVVDGGLSTIFAASKENGGLFDDEKSIDLADEKFYEPKIVDAWTGNVRNNWKTVTDSFVTFAEKKRKDCIFISDPLRHIFVQGPNKKILSDKTKSFAKNVYWPLRHLYGAVNTSYGAAYGNWAKVYDGKLDKQIWAPFSGILAGTYANVDTAFQPWFAPAGFTRGVVTGVSDLALYPNQKERDLLYKINLNPIANFPNDGFVVFGQKTLQTKPSAFDRINVRRLFLYLEKATRGTAKYFVFEPNTLFTRTQVVNVLTPLFENAKNTEGLYDYLIICDERNNTPDVIDQNELVIDIYLKPTRAAEFILVNFYATRTGQDFSELVS